MIVKFIDVNNVKSKSLLTFEINKIEDSPMMCDFYDVLSANEQNHPNWVVRGIHTIGTDKVRVYVEVKRDED